MLEYMVVFIIGVIVQLFIGNYAEKLGYGYGKILNYIALLSTGIMFIFLNRKFGLDYKFFIYSATTTLLIHIALVDLKTHTIPNEFNLWVCAIGVVNMVINYEYFGTFLLSGLGAGAFYLAIALLTGGGIGGGDIKLIAPLGLIFGYLPIVRIICLTFLIGAAFIIIPLLTRRNNLFKLTALAPFITLAVFVQLFYY